MKDTSVPMNPRDSPDAADDDLFNRILWQVVKGDAVPYPGPRRIPVREIVLSR